MKTKEEFDVDPFELLEEDTDAVLVEPATPNCAAASTSWTTTTSFKSALALIGKNVKTPFGVGFVLDYRAEDEVFVIKLTSVESHASLAILYTKWMPTRYETPSERADTLNVAYEALENMRRMNLEVNCHEIGIYEEIDHEYCTTCLISNMGRSGRSHFPRLQKLVDHAAATDLEAFPALRRLFHSTSNDGAAESEVDHEDSNPTASTVMVQHMKLPSKDNIDVDHKDNNAEHLSTSNNHLLQQSMTKSMSPMDKQLTFPRLRKIWGQKQNIPQPSATAGQPPNNEISVLSASAAAAVQQQLPAKQQTSDFPRIRGNIGVSDIFNTTTSSNNCDPSKTMAESMASFPKLRNVFDTSATSSFCSSMSISQKSSASVSSSSFSRAGMLEKQKPVALPRIQKLIDQRQKANTSPCLVCASPSCSAHSSASFRREGITLCLQCEKFFELDFIVDCISSPDPLQRFKHINHMIDCYDRCMLLLEYSSQFVEQIAKSLEEEKERQNKVGLASSSIGALSGVLGLAAAASVLTPAGPPLLIASLFFGGGATSVQTGTEAMNYFSEPRKLAHRIIALHGMALSLLRVTSTLRDAMLRDHIRTDVYAVEPAPLKEQVQMKLEKHRVAVLAGSNVGRSMALGGVAGMEVGAGAAGAVVAGAASEMGAAGAAGAIAAGAASEMGAAGAAAGAAGARGVTAVSRAGTVAARTVSFARFAGGALSAAVLVMEANAIQSKLKSIHDGSPCDKANELRRVAQEFQHFPTSSDLDRECQAYLKVLVDRPPPPPVAEASAVPDNFNVEVDIPEAICQEVTDGGYHNCASEGVIIIERDGPGSEPQLRRGQPTASASIATSSFVGRLSLMQRMHDRLERHQHMSMSRTEEVVAVAVDDAQLTESGINLVL
jgi:hypothetical protein